MQLKDFESLEKAKEHVTTLERMISHDMVLVFLTKNSCIKSLRDSDDESAQGFWLAVSSGVQEFNVMNSHEVGKVNQSLLSHLVNVGAVNQAFADDCITYANKSIKPYENATLYQFLKAKNQCPLKEAVNLNGWIKIVTKAACESHRPQVFVEVSGIKKRIAGFEAINEPGEYICQVPRGYAKYFVEDAYDVIEEIGAA